MSNYTVLCGDALTVLRDMPDSSVHCCITSPPYYGLRDYGTGRWEGGDSTCQHSMGNQVPDRMAPRAIVSNVRPGVDASKCRKCGARRVDSQIGLEPAPSAYIARLVEVFHEVRRVLRDDGTLWVVIGDSYTGGGNDGGGSFAKDGIRAAEPGTNKNKATRFGRRGAVGGIKPKDLIGIPWMLAFALRADGWYLRQDVVWAKPNPMPESVKDRCTRSHEYIFMLSKSRKYHYDAAAIAEPGVAMNHHDATGQGYAAPGQTPQQGNRKTDKQRGHSRRHAGFNDRRDAMERGQQCGTMRNKRDVWTVATQPCPEAHFAIFPQTLIEPCILAGCPAGGVVLDPFAGAGTTGLVCMGTGRRYVGIELRQEYIDIARRRAAAHRAKLLREGRTPWTARTTKTDM